MAIAEFNYLLFKDIKPFMSKAYLRTQLGIRHLFKKSLFIKSICKSIRPII